MTTLLLTGNIKLSEINLISSHIMIRTYFLFMRGKIVVGSNWMILIMSYILIAFTAPKGLIETTFRIVF